MNSKPDDPGQLLANLLQASEAAARMFAPPGANASRATGQLSSDLVSVAREYAGVQQEFFRQLASYWEQFMPRVTAWPRTTPDGAAVEQDKRFVGDSWTSDPRFELVKRAYLAYSLMLQQAAEAAPVDEPTKARLRMGTRQFVEALSPSNFFLSNPEAMSLAAQTGGQSVAEGMRLFLEDLARGRISTNDQAAFEVGKSLAVTPGAVIFENEIIQLIQYRPLTAQVHARPLVMIPPCINKFYIMDLQPENSLVRYLVEQGHTVFMLSWRNVGEEQGTLTWDDYLEDGVLKALSVARSITGADCVNTLGFCIGGTLLSTALAVAKARDEDPAASITLMTAMLDFRDTGEIGALVTEKSVAAREAKIGSGGIMHGKELGFAFSSLRANDLMWQYVVNSYLKGKAPPAFDMLYWNADNTNLPGPMFCWYIRNCYLENNVRVPGRTELCGEAIDLTTIDIPAFVYASREDHIVPWRTAYASTELLSGDVRFVLGASGHIAGVINHPAKKKRQHWLAGNPTPDPDQWLATAREVPGSWWPDWSEWLSSHAGPKVTAPKRLGKGRYREIELAPGRYVAAKAS
ncbi:MAG: class I poly(R)-hydroxyalkanoic acid synthase [Pseudomonadota bacterium]|nr:class I poly(R)-hydroxyalkanoic acid synthase [Pseudomonadota bacterium]